MPYLELEVKTAIIVHGYDENNREVTEEVHETAFVKKLIAIERIQSISEQYLLVSSSHGRIMYWEYKGSMKELKDRLKLNGVTIV